MEHKGLDDHVRNEFRSMLNVLIHFSMSLTEFLSILTLLGLQIALTVTQTCAFRLGIVFWSFPFLFLSPLSLWLVLWRRNTTSCFIAILLHFCSTLFATGIIIVSFLVLIDQIGFACSTLSSSNSSSSTMLNSVLIGIAGLLKLFNYIEIILLYFLIKTNNHPSKIDEVNVWGSWSTIPSETYSFSDIFFA